MALTNQCRIIGGQWRGRKIQFPSQSAIRPTPDRVRETLFNWLMQVIPGAQCFDPFAGSGALAFEALSRGAAHVVAVESDKHVCQQLEKTAEQLSTSDITIIQGVSPNCWSQVDGPFDIIFLDPPFDRRLIIPMLEALSAQHLLKPSSLIYTESDCDEWAQSGLDIVKSKKASSVHFALLRAKAHISNS